MRSSESQEYTDTALAEIAWLSAHNPNQVYHSLIHHFSEDSLRHCFDRLDGKKAVGVDRVSKTIYGENLSANLEDLIARMKRMSYRPWPVREVLIPKEGKKGATRPLGISNFEDKLIQKRMQEILESIYEPLFLNSSYGFRPGKSCHDALNEEKTKMVNFSKSKSRQGIKQEAFDYLGFSFYLGKSRNGVTIPKLKTSGKRFRSKLKKVTEWAKGIRNKAKLGDIWKIFCSKLRGHVQYYGVSFNDQKVEKFLFEARKIIFKWLNRRSQRKSFSWKKFSLYVEAHPLPVAKVIHRLF